MFALSFSFEDIHTWLVTNGLEILLLVLGSILASRFTHWVSRKAEASVSRRATAQIQQELVRSEPSKYIHSAIQAVDWVIRSLIYFVASILILLRFEVPLSTLIAPATVLGLGLGFGAQRIVQDLLSGFFIFTERQYGVGDTIRISAPGTMIGVSGTVEEVTLRITRLRTIAGELIVIPNGQILQVANLSRDWSQVVIDLQIPLEKSVERAKTILEEQSELLADSEKFAPLLLSRPQVTGVESITLGYLQLRVIVKTLPSRQWEVARELRMRLVEALSAEDLLPDSSSASIVQQAM